jgi:WbqC-like protein family
MRIAIMQPYFYPYAGYFRLFACTDLFIVLDTVQFPRRGWVHRNRLLNTAAKPDWLTVPLDKTPREATIGEQMLRRDAETTLRASARRFPVLGAAAGEHEFCRLLFAGDRPLVDYLLRQLTAVCEWLDLATPIVLASAVDIDPELRGAARLIAIARAFSADVYVNAPGGRGLYDRGSFSHAGIDLRFLADYVGNSLSILQRALSEPVGDIRRDITAQCALR